MAVGDVYQLAHNQSLYGVQVVNVLHYQTEIEPTSGTEEADIATEFLTGVIGPMFTNLSTAWTSDCMVVRKLGPGASTPYTQLTGLPGTVAGEAMPPNAVGVLSFYTDDFTKSGRGRTYISGMLTSDEADNCWTDAAAARLDLIAQAIRDDLDAIGGGTGTYASGIWTGTPKTFKNTIIREVRSQVRKLRGRTMRRACG